MSKIVYQNNISEPTNQHHRAGLLKYIPGANKSAPQGQSIKITPGANKSAPQGQSIEITTRSQ